MTASIGPMAFTWTATLRVSTARPRSPMITPSGSRRNIVERGGSLARSGVQHDLMALVDERPRGGKAQAVCAASDEDARHRSPCIGPRIRLVVQRCIDGCSRPGSCEIYAGVDHSDDARKATLDDDHGARRCPTEERRRARWHLDWIEAWDESADDSIAMLRPAPIDSTTVTSGRRLKLRAQSFASRSSELRPAPALTPTMSPVSASLISSIC
jgi:hypothetical protein